jgi:hypothetical protein
MARHRVELEQLEEEEHLVRVRVGVRARARARVRGSRWKKRSTESVSSRRDSTRHAPSRRTMAATRSAAVSEQPSSRESRKASGTSIAPA